MAEGLSRRFPYSVDKSFNILQKTLPNASDTNTIIKTQLHQLKITGTIATGPTLRSQLFLCQISPGTLHTRNKVLAAKVWDPVYHPEPSLLATLSPTEQATLGYNNERTAFERIEETQLKSPNQYSPQYYGSWSLQCPEASAKQKQKENAKIRTVPLILMEYVQGCCMKDLQCGMSGSIPCLLERCDEDYRLAVLARILEIESWLDHIGIEHNDIAPRNFMIYPAPNLPDPPTTDHVTRRISLAESKPCRVTIIDFDRSILHPPSEESRPQNPIDKYWGLEIESLLNWIPYWWRGDLQARRVWLLKHFGGSKYYRTVPPDRSRERVNVFDEDETSLMDSFGYPRAS